MRAKLTKRLVDSLVPGERDLFVWDTDMRSFGLKLTPTGARIYVVQYRLGGRGSLSRRYTIGRHGVLTVDEARDEARKVLAERARGNDPVAQKEHERRNAQRAVSFSILARDWIAHEVKPRLRSAAEIERIVERELITSFGARSLSRVTQDDMIKVLDAIVERGRPQLANKVLAVARMLFNHFADRRLVEVAPTAGIKPPSEHVTRDRVLEDSEIKVLWPAFTDLGWPFEQIFKLLLITAQRRDEVASMRWRDVDLTAATWRIPRELNKSKREHVVPLPKLAIQMIEACPRKDDLLVFPARRNQANHVSGFSKAKLRVAQAAMLEPNWRIHDLRRTAASGMARLGTPPHVIEKILNHSSGVISGVAAIYNRHQYSAEKATALDAWSAHLKVLIAGAPLETSSAVEQRAA